MGAQYGNSAMPAEWAAKFAMYDWIRAVAGLLDLIALTQSDAIRNISPHFGHLGISDFQL